ncbi:pyruvate dehydrogenase complex transcriptional repressor PdhR [Planctobacterium marinum]|uniref:pyruvate dehydrogenase complex transcriptional repressor PdhR n=1 Tax=Planctobacterium marinum TaxID=1631968 RepID=UPI001E362563|nr:pyruvate dehydrogenase complex transcriptional repressor PdhR [Planctobacterium marinum]MCC2605410.1 pyruvate dehydrogenase complex transcriptional repressor PdhR [Planctobacterium marinum]
MQKIQNKKLSDIIVERLEAMLLEGQFLAGQKLPPERQLAEEFNVSRPSLREAIQKLEAKGLLLRKQGGGTWVSDKLAPKVTDPLMQLIATYPESQFDLLEFRHALEGMAAYYAALRGDEGDFLALNQALTRTEVAYKDDCVEKQAESLVEFYLCMAKGSHNVVLLHIMGNLLDVLKDNIEGNLALLRKRPDEYQQIHQQRKQIVAAIVSGNPELARQASNEHLAFIEKTLLEINSEDTQMQRALRRIEVGGKRSH